MYFLIVAVYRRVRGHGGVGSRTLRENNPVRSREPRHGEHLGRQWQASRAVRLPATDPGRSDSPCRWRSEPRRCSARRGPVRRGPVRRGRCGGGRCGRGRCCRGRCGRCGAAGAGAAGAGAAGAGAAGAGAAAGTSTVLVISGLATVVVVVVLLDAPIPMAVSRTAPPSTLSRMTRPRFFLGAGRVGVLRRLRREDDLVLVGVGAHGVPLSV